MLYFNNCLKFACFFFTLFQCQQHGYKDSICTEQNQVPEDVVETDVSKTQNPFSIILFVRELQKSQTSRVHLNI